jgi:hypothetical protein
LRKWDLEQTVIEVVISLAARGIRLGLILPPDVDLPEPNLRVPFFAVDLPLEISDIAE